MRFATLGAALALAVSPAAAQAPEPGTWSADCKRKPPLETLYIGNGHFYFADAACDSGKWRRTATGAATKATCAGDGITPSAEPFTVTPQTTGRLLIVFGGGKINAQYCGPSIEAR